MRKTKLLLTALLMHVLLALTHTNADTGQINNTKSPISISGISLSNTVNPGIVTS